MRIGHFNYNSESIGGIASYIARLGMGQRSHGHEVYFFDCSPLKSNATSEWTHIEVRDTEELYDAARRLRLDVLHLHTVVDQPYPEGLCVVRTVHTHSPYCPSGSKYLARKGHVCGRDHGWGQCLLGHFLHHCGSVRPWNMVSGFRSVAREHSILSLGPVITVSDYQRDQMLRSGYPNDTVHTIHNFAPAPVERVRLSATGPLRFVFAGRLVPTKGLVWLLRALAKTRVPVHLDVAGMGYQEGAIRDLVQRLGMVNRVVFHGWLGEGDIRKLMIASRALVFPSRWPEPAGLVALEAMAHGRPIIASRVGGIPEMVSHEGNGLLVEPGDEAGLAAALDRLAQDHVFAQRLGDAGRELAGTRFSLQRHMERIEAIYHSAIISIPNPRPIGAVSLS